MESGPGVGKLSERRTQRWLAALVEGHLGRLAGVGRGTHDRNSSAESGKLEGMQHVPGNGRLAKASLGLLALSIALGAARATEAGPPGPPLLPSIVARCAQDRSHAGESDCLVEVLPLMEAAMRVQLAETITRIKEAEEREEVARLQVTALISDQERWLAYRDAHCAWLDSLIEGSDSGTAEVRCQVEMTDDRMANIATFAGVRNPALTMAVPSPPPHAQ
jgi:uncharacterized protein YecT (DUF1311 family)